MVAMEACLQREVNRSELGKCFQISMIETRNPVIMRTKLITESRAISIFDILYGKNSRKNKDK